MIYIVIIIIGIVTTAITYLYLFYPPDEILIKYWKFYGNKLKESFPNIKLKYKLASTTNSTVLQTIQYYIFNMLEAEGNVFDTETITEETDITKPNRALLFCDAEIEFIDAENIIKRPYSINTIMERYKVELEKNMDKEIFSTFEKEEDLKLIPQDW